MSYNMPIFDAGIIYDVNIINNNKEKSMEFNVNDILTVFVTDTREIPEELLNTSYTIGDIAENVPDFDSEPTTYEMSWQFNNSTFKKYSLNNDSDIDNKINQIIKDELDSLGVKEYEIQDMNIEADNIKTAVEIKIVKL